MVSAGFIAAEDGKKPPSTTHRFSTSCARHQGSSTLAAGSCPATTVPHWWLFMLMSKCWVRMAS